MSMRRTVAALLAACVLAGGLAGCGKKSSLLPPTDEPGMYPRKYPHQELGPTGATVPQSKMPEVDSIMSTDILQPPR